MGLLVVLPHGVAQLLMGLASHQRGVWVSARGLKESWVVVRACFLEGVGTERAFVIGPRLTSGEWKLSVVVFL